jgi:hypothetical protein
MEAAAAQSQDLAAANWQSPKSEAGPQTTGGALPRWRLNEEDYWKWVQDLVDAAVRDGADPKALNESVAAYRRGTAKAIINTVCSPCDSPCFMQRIMCLHVTL